MNAQEAGGSLLLLSFIGRPDGLHSFQEKKVPKQKLSLSCCSLHWICVAEAIQPGFVVRAPVVLQFRLTWHILCLSDVMSSWGWFGYFSRQANVYESSWRSDWDFWRSGLFCVSGNRRAQTSYHVDEEGEESQFSAVWGNYQKKKKKPKPENSVISLILRGLNCAIIITATWISLHHYNTECRALV